jgi:invasion protein IalB
MSTTLRFGIFFIFSVLLFSACDSDSLSEDEVTVPAELSSTFNLLIEADETSDADLTLDVLVIDGDEEMEAVRGGEAVAQRLRFHGDCFSIVFPIDIAFPDGTTATTNDARDARSTVAAWIRANRGVINRTSRIALVYPVNVLLADGTEVELMERTGFRRLVAACARDTGGTAQGGSRDTCFTYAFPINFTSAAGRFQAQNAVEFARLLASQNHQVVFPFDVILANGNTLAITDAGSYRTSLQRCSGDGGSTDEDCLAYVYPINYANANGRTRSANNDREHEALKANSDFTIVFPFDVIREDRSTLTVTGVDMYRRLLADCP